MNAFRSRRIASCIGAAACFLQLTAVAAPPWTDYCRMLGRDIEGKQYAFIAGNHMYFTHTGKGYEMYPHTQTAINNFMGLHLWDSWVYTAMGSWVADRDAWGYGNVLSWKFMVPFKDKNNGLPDNFGTTWYSPGVRMNLVGSVELSWDMYLKSGDRKFLNTVYNELFRPLYWDNNGPITDLVLKRLAGVQYSIPDQTFTVREHMPETWDFLDVQVPIAQNDDVDWVQVRVEQRQTKRGVRKSVSVKNNPLRKLVIEPWLADRDIVSSVPDAATSPPGHHRFAYADTRDKSLVLDLGETKVVRRTLAALTPRERIFGESMAVNVVNLEPNTTLHYSTDGRDPGASSPECNGPITLTKTTNLKLRAFTRDGVARSPMSVTFTKAELLPASSPESTRPGLSYQLFRGKWKQIPDMSKLEADRTGVAEDLNVADIAGQREDFATQFNGFIKVPEDGLYDFTVRSDDGSRLVIDGQTVVELDVLCARDAWSGDGMIALKRGYHKIRIDYFQAGAHITLRIRASVNGGPHTPVRPDMLFHGEGK